ncbi:EAL and HDOD domain-containing protein [Psychrobium sp. 1_MG-2023]|uniref:EAL and HDOD domain-containing protein n=1 Tax=Psychrobium sp. 1_MG-2023 TaxID=3062624 RepID=UPI000C336513|nr:HDOD domain-containing protein [Psychrobium sp. 1_MG-2023]MDP2559594.1 HDOD domain-containing protein [Psychrobium sp. 1_MG-2023]PKF59428.1 EAL domain-containing protein [Alteromonadales bacterium alter-6D02]
MFFHAARQPILDLDLNLWGYELLFRDGLTNAFPDIDGSEATSRLIAGSQFDFSLSDFIGDKPAFINFTLETLVNKYPSLVPKEQLVVEVLETERPGKRLLAEVKELHEQGYTVVLDDYTHQPVWRHFFPYISMLKIDVLESDPEDIQQAIDAIKDFPHIKLLAEKVETQAQFESAKSLGFSYFQGYFFAHPEVVQAKALSPAQFSLAELLYETSKAELDLPKIIKVFELDVNLAYKLLRYSNSAIFRRRAEISSIKQALITLGKSELQKFISVLFSAQVGSDKPPELMAMSLTRAKFAEGLALKSSKVDDSSVAFLTGMLSLIDAILGETMESAMEKLPLAQEIKDALVQQEGPLARLVEIARSYETSNWEASALQLESLGIEEAAVPEIYQSSLQWSNAQMEYVLSNEVVK